MSESLDNKLERLKGKILIGIKLDNNDLIIETTTENISFHPYAECCSNSWIEHFDEVKEPSEIIEMKEIEIPPSFEEKPTKTDNCEEEMSYYFYEITTDKGSYMIEMRNSSNGYYGGSLE